MHIIEPTAPLHGGVGFRNENVFQVEILPQLFPPQRYTPFTPYIPHLHSIHTTPTSPNPSKPHNTNVSASFTLYQIHT